jgi:hypothetical protein
MGHNVNVYHKLKRCNNKKRDLVVTEIAKLYKIKFKNSVCYKLCAVPQETCDESAVFRRQGKDKCLYRGIVRKAVTAIIVVGLDAVVEKMYT